MIMKIWLMTVCLFLLVGASAHADELDAKSKAAYTTLKSVARFATDSVGRGSGTSEGELALRVLLKQKQAEDVLQSLLKEAAPAGQMYALVGLRSVSQAAFEKAVKPFLPDKTKAGTMSGCIVRHETVAKVADAIRLGNHSLRPARK